MVAAATDCDDSAMAIDRGPRPRTAMGAPPLAAVGLALMAVTLSIILSGLRAGQGGGSATLLTPAPATPRPSPIVSHQPTASPTPTATPTQTPTPVATPTPAPAMPVPTPTSTPRPPSGPPACAYDDVLTPHHGYGDWPISLLDTIYHLPAGYAPGDLADSATAGLNGGFPLRSLVIADLAAMAAGARANGTPIALVSGYRSHAQQEATFQYWVNVGGYEQALRTSARAGHSEHQLGTTIDVTDEGGAAPWESADWAATPAGAWMAANAWRHGFVMSYPRSANAQACYDYEPWHYRYVGRDLAAAIHADGRVPRLVLWELQ